MGSKGRLPPAHLRHPLPGPGMQADPFGPGIRTPPGAFSPFDMLPPPEVMEQKIAAQHGEMRKLATENQRLAATHGTLRQELAAAQHELQIVHSHIGAMKSEREQQMRGLVDKIAKIEAELQAAEPIKMDLQQARADAESLVAARQELISKMQQLTQDHQRIHSDVHQIPALISELESLRQEYQHCRVTYDYEKKLYTDHLESLQVMEKNYITMAREVEKLRAELANAANNDRRTGGPYGGSTGYDENVATGHYTGGYDNSYGVPQGQVPLPGGGGGGAATAGGGGTPHAGTQSGLSPATAGYDAQRGPGYDIQRGNGGPGYNMQRGPTGPGYDAQKGPTYDTQRGSSYDPHKLPGYDGQRGPNYDTSRAGGYDAAASRGAVGPQGQVAPPNNVAYGSAAPPPTRGGSGYEAQPRGGNPVYR